jgi:hypothetical protein
MLKLMRDSFQHLKWILVAIVAIFILFIFVDWGAGGAGSGGAIDQRAFAARVNGETISYREFDRALYYVHPDHFIVVELQLFQSWQAAQKSTTAAGNDAFLYGCAGGVHGVLDASLLLLQLCLRCRAHLDYRNPTDELGKALLELFLVVV